MERTLAGSAPPPKPCVAAARDAAATPDAAVLAARGIVLRTPGCNVRSNGTPGCGAGRFAAPSEGEVYIICATNSRHAAAKN